MAPDELQGETYDADVSTDMSTDVAKLRSLTALLRRAWALSPVRYLMVGGCLFLIDLGVFMVLTEVGVPIPVAQVVARATGGLVGFVGHKYVTFRSAGQTSRGPAQMVLYAVLFAANLTLSAFVISGAITLCMGFRVPGKILGESVMVCMTFLGNRFIFRSEADGSATQEEPP